MVSIFDMFTADDAYAATGSRHQAYTTSSSATSTRIDYDKILELMRDLPMPKVAYCHPNNIAYFRDNPVATVLMSSEYAPEFAAPVWEPDSWGTYATLEKSDESWARPIGLGKMVDKKQRVAYFVDESAFMSQYEITPPNRYSIPPFIGIEPRGLKNWAS